ncbi:oxidoreductase [Geojedonia litorea]|uniref:Oxidoreductase n=1 Tax=Geojedonia litorea TaxID=1268269 RepID=A0ABV9MZ01_9FLAO
MKRLLICFSALVFLISCGKKDEFIPRNFNSVEIETILEDSTLSIRAIILLDSNSLAFAANRNTYGLYNIKLDKWLVSEHNYDSLPLEFRAVAHTISDFFMLSVGNPALLFKTTENGTMGLVYEEHHPDVFYDAMHFWNDQEGIAIGDSIDGCLSVIVTRTGGELWGKLSCNDLPKAEAHEGAFAASDTNIAIVGDHTWVATTAGRVYYSPDRGHTWQVFETPIVKQLDTEGIYSIDFYDALNGFAIGGDYTKPEGNSANKIRTNNGGKSWKLVGQNQYPGYRSCVQYFPNSVGKELITVGFKGIDFSNDSGSSWKHLSDEGFYTVRFLNDSVAYAAGKGRISKLTFKE